MFISPLAKFFISIVVIIATIFVATQFHFYHTFFIVLLPKTWDAKWVNYWFRRDLNNTGIESIPKVFRNSPNPYVSGDVQRCVESSGGPRLLKNFVNASDSQALLRLLTKGNQGKEIRLLDYSKQDFSHFSPSCANKGAQDSLKMPFDQFAAAHLLGENVSSHSYYYAGFESITDRDVLKEITGYDWGLTGQPYNQNNLFVSNLPRDVLTAPLHAEPIDSFAVQLVGVKYWFLVAPEDVNSFPTIPLPTAFNLPMTDDKLIGKIPKIYVVKQEPGDLLYFGPHWGHVVITTEGPNLMFNVRIDAQWKVRNGPKGLLAKVAFRIRDPRRNVAGRPQDNTLNFPLIYDDLNSYYPTCGKSEAFTELERIAKEKLNGK